nr:TonB-dependent receptor [Nitrospirillum iridis]
MLGASALWLICGPSVHAQEQARPATTHEGQPAARPQGAPPPGEPPLGVAPATGTGELEEIVVTAQRRAENLQKIPIAITAISGDELASKARSSVDSALQDIPAVQVQAGAQGSQVYIRGVGTNGDPNSIDTDIAVFFDNVYTGRNEQLGAGLYDISRVEVLRGPQGTLYGRNAVGGTINVISNSPVQEYGGAVNLQVGDYGLRHVDAAVNVPVDETLAVRLAALRETKDGYYSNGGGATDVTGLRLKGLWKPTPALSLLGVVDYQHITGLGATTVSVSNFEAGHPWTAEEGFEDRLNYRFLTTSVQMDYDFDWATLTVIPAYSYSDRYIFTDLISGSRAVGDYQEKQYTGEIRLASPSDSAVKWQVGAYGLRSTNLNLVAPSAGTTSTTGYTAYYHNPPTTSYSVFGQATYPVTDSLRLTAGLRYTDDKKGYAYGIRSSYTLPGTSTYYDSGLLTTPDEKDSGVTYKAGVEYDLTADSMVYAQVATGFKAGGYNTSQLPPQTYEPEKLTAYEVGAKNRFLDNRLEVNAEAYYYDYKNYQLQYPLFGAGQDINTLYSLLLSQYGASTALTYANAHGLCGTSACTLASPPGQFTQPVANADTGTSYGADLEAKYRLTPHDEITLSIAYMHARYGNVAAVSDISGTQVASAPTWSGVIGYEHSWDLAGGLLTVRGESKLSTGYVTTTSLSFPHHWQPGYSRSDAYVSYVFPDDRYTIGAFVHNIEDRAQVTAAFPNSRLLVTTPRTFGFTASAKF